jgi:hypothetical protein
MYFFRYLDNFLKVIVTPQGLWKNARVGEKISAYFIVFNNCLIYSKYKKFKQLSRCQSKMNKLKAIICFLRRHHKYDYYTDTCIT